MHDKRSMTLARALRVLDLHPAADRKEVRQAYLDLVRVWHPDRFQGDERLREKACWRLSEINAAYQLLTARNHQAAGVEGSSFAGDRPGARANTRLRPAAVQPLPQKLRRDHAARIGAVVATLAVAAACVLAWSMLPRTRTSTARAAQPDRPVMTLPRTNHTIAAPVAPARRKLASMVEPSGQVKSPFSRDLDRALARSSVQVDEAVDTVDHVP